ncbi:chromosome partitioning protein [Rhodococcus percolatus]|uniref:ParA family protein n=1 Tax=Rhodococcus opacus TaxID=37919 RepID=UPI0015FA63B6|nr:ParA family protein [Rhodococcus opacus]MBA8965073.1 chromosome partitioning protein [Rhodococcus opacus]MBP2209646.1 chromosome partitioning protein [Rhodococcus opacus]
MTARHRDGKLETLILTICNQKGGTGKTTTTFHLARAAVLAGLRVLLIDMDPQGNLSKIAARSRVETQQLGVADVLTEDSEYELREVIVEGRWEGIYLAPTSGRGLMNLRNELVAANIGRELRLRKALEDLRGEYDLIFIDCPPSVDQLTINGLVACDEAIVVTESTLFGADGLGQLGQTIEDVQEYFHPDLRIRGVVVNKHEAREVSASDFMARLQKWGPVLEPAIPLRVCIKDSSQSGMGLDEWTGDRKSPQMAALYNELLPAVIGERNVAPA